MSFSEQSTLNKQPHSGYIQYDRQGLEISQSHDVAPQEVVVESLPAHLIVIHTTPQPVEVIERGDRFRLQELAKPGDVNILSAGSMASCQWSEAISYISLNIPPALIEQTVAQTDNYTCCSQELTETWHTHDAKILQISQWLLDESHNGGVGGKLYVDSLLNVLAVHLLRSYTSEFRERRSPQRLTQQQVARAIDYMHANLNRDISLEVLARTVNISPSHLRRLFKQATGVPPHQYLTSLRVNRAKELLLTGSFTVSEVATEVGFADQSHLHRHFKRMFGITPKAVLAG